MNNKEFAEEYEGFEFNEDAFGGDKMAELEMLDAMTLRRGELLFDQMLDDLLEGFSTTQATILMTVLSTYVQNSQCVNAFMRFLAAHAMNDEEDFDDE